ncbi:MAG TPA: lipid-A-disaccharide synthase [Candidatus Omnitrophica bacterium]|nr:lipid-A-disaccharide synthase [Candidatus Omnitrophota bacterium]
MRKRTIMIVAGEPSGDIHGACIIKSLKSLNPSLEFIGAGGKRMVEAGLKGIGGMENFAIVGFKEVCGKIRLLKRNFEKLSRMMRCEKPDCFIPIDYPGFNLRLAEVAKSTGIPVFYYISPQVWAWGKNRIKKIQKYVDKMYVILPFEEEFYSRYGVKAEFVGHPLLDIVKPVLGREEALSYFHLDRDKPVIGLLPGSRWEEIRLSLPVMVDVCRIISCKIPEIQFSILVAENIDARRVKSLLNREDSQIHLVKEKPYEFMNLCDLLLVNSGTATLEAAILGRPMVIIYKLSFFSWILGKILIRIPNFGLVNIIAGEEIVPEFLQFGARSSVIAKEILHMLHNRNKRERIQRNLYKVKEKLGKNGASQRAAKAILEELVVGGECLK